MEPSGAPAGGKGDGPLPVLLNPRAGRADPDLPRRIAAALARAGRAAEVREVDPARLGEEVSRAAARGAPVVAVGGGDGSLLSAAQVLAGGRAALLPLPTGTLNHFARRLDVVDLETAVDALVGGRTVRVPLGTVGERVFLNTATFGVYAEVVRRRERLRPWLSKWPAAALALLLWLARLRRLEVEIEVDGERLRRLTPLVWVGIGYGSFPRVHESLEGPRGSTLEIVVLRPRGRLGILALLPRLLVERERPVRHPALEVLHARSLTIRAPRSVGITLDGEVMRLPPPLRVAIREDALRVVVPDPAPGTVAPPPRTGLA